ncbi:hypothetical protein D9M68_927890 [compost metagenome]
MKILMPISWKSARMISGSAVIMVSSRSRSGQTTRITTVPTMVILSRPLRKLTSDSPENRRLAPASGEILESFGVIGSIDSSGRCWMRLASTAQAESTTSGMRTVPISAMARLLKKAPKPAPPSSN